MSNTVIQVDNLWKKYRLGVVGTGTLRHDLNRWWHRVRGKADPYAIVGYHAGPQDNGTTRQPDPASPPVDLSLGSNGNGSPNPVVSDHVVGNEAVRGPVVSAPAASGPSALANDEIWALQGISFEVKQGEILGIIGRNGAGKSTLLKILSRVTAPSKGEVRVKGRIASLLEVGTGFHPELTGRENIFLNGAILGMTKAEIKQKLGEIVAFAEVEKYLDTPVKRYSSGMYVRLAFSVAAHLEPEILIIDEVLAVGDAAFQKKCLGKMGSVAKEGRTVLFVSHNMGAIKSLCTRAILLDSGSVAIDGGVDQVVDDYYALTSAVRCDEGFIPDEAPRPWSTSEARLRSVKLMDNSQSEITKVYFGQPFRIQITFEVFSDISDVVFEVGIATSDGTRVIFVSNIDGGKPPARFTRGRHNVAVDMDVILLPRQYVIDLAIHHRDGITIDWVEHTMDFLVLNVPKTGSDYYPWSQARGFVQPAAHWHGLDSAELSSTVSIAGG